VAIKKRTALSEEERAAKIAAFGDAASPRSEAPAEAPQAAPAARAPRTTKAAPSPDEETVPAPSLIRWGKDKDLRAEIGRIADEEDRSVNAMILRLLRDGIDAYNAKR
jgi:hypothetical protein